MLQHVNRQIKVPSTTSPCVGHHQTLTVCFYSSFCFKISLLVCLRLVSHAFRESHIHVISFCNLIGGALAEPPEVNGLNLPMLPGYSLLRTKEEMSLGTRLSLGIIGIMTQVPHTTKVGHYYTLIVFLLGACFL